MNKFLLFLCALLVIGFAQSSIIDKLDIKVIYEKFINISKVMADTDEYNCSANLLKNKDSLIPIITNITNAIKRGRTLYEAFLENASAFEQIEGILDDCNINNNLGIIFFLTTEKGIQQFGKNIIKNADTLENLFNELMTTLDMDSKLLVIAKIIKITTGITFH